MSEYLRQQRRDQIADRAWTVFLLAVSLVCLVIIFGGPQWPQKAALAPVGVRLPSGTQTAQAAPVLSEGGASERFWLTQLALRRADDREVLSQLSGSLDDDPSARSSIEVKTVTAVVEVPQDPWQPADECARVPNPGPVFLTPAVMRWCPTVAHYLDLADRLGLPWLPGDLFRNLVIISCESNGYQYLPDGRLQVNSASGTTGLYQHRPEYWDDRGRRAAEFFGFDNPTITSAYDNIAVGVWLFRTGGRGHWEYCGGNWGGAPAETLRNAGY